VSLDPLSYTEEEYRACLEMNEVEELGTEYDLITGEKKGKHGKKDNKVKRLVKTTKTSKGENATNDSNVTNNDKSSSSSPSLHQLLSQNNKVLPWTKAETDALMELARACDLRWPVIIDRWHSRFRNCPTSGLRKVEDLQHRYYSVGSILAQRRVEVVMAREAANLTGGAAAAVVVSGSGVAEPAVGSGAGGATPANASAVASGPVVDAVASSSSSAANTGNDALRSTAATSDFRPLAPSSTQQQTSLPPAEAEALRTTQQLTALHPSLAPPLSLPGTGTAHRGAKMFDLAAERARRAHLDRIWNRSKAEEREEEELRAELRAVEAQLRKLKKSGKHLAPVGSALAAPPIGTGPPIAMGDGAGGGPALAGMPGGGGAHPAHLANAVKRGAAGAASAARRKGPTSSLFPPRAPPDPFLYTRRDVAASFADTAPVPTPGTPYLQSGRLFPPSVEGHSGLNKSTLKQMGAILNELNVPKEPIPTKRSCDLYDGVRKEALTLLILQKMVLRKEAELTAKRAKLAKMRGEAAAKVEAAVKFEEGKAEEGKDVKEEGAKGGNKSKKTKTAKAKRPRADSVASGASSQGDAAGEGGTGKKGGDGSKKKPRKKSVAVQSAPAATSSTAPPSAASAMPFVPAPPGPVIYGAIPSMPNNATVSPMVASGKQHHSRPQPTNLIPTPLSSSVQPAGANMGAAASVAAPPLAIHPGKTAKKTAKKPRGRKKS